MKCLANCILVMGLSLFIVSCGGGKGKNDPASPIVATTPSHNSEVFNKAFGTIMNYYFELKDDLSDEKDSSAINHAALEMMKAVDSLPIQELKADSNFIAAIYTSTQSISSELQGLLGEKDLLNKRKEFQITSEQLYDLITTVKYDRVVLYHFYCPTAFPDQAASWLSNTSQIKNPYSLQSKGCGEIRDTIDFRAGK